MRREPIGHFRGDAARARFVEVYQRALGELPPYDESMDVPTTFGTVRVYRFDGPAGRPVVLLPGRNAATPMWKANLPGLLADRTVFSVDLMGEPGLSVQQRPITGSEDQAQWFGEMLGGLAAEPVHLLGVSFGGWAAVNYAVRRGHGRVASLTLLDPVMTFAPIPKPTMLAVAPLALPWVPGVLRRGVLQWISGGAAVDDSDPVAALIAAGSRDHVVRQPFPKRFTEDQLRDLDIPVLAILAGRSVVHDATRAANAARMLLQHGQVKLWADASHALSGEYPAEIDALTRRFWCDVDTPR